MHSRLFGRRSGARRCQPGPRLWAPPRAEASAPATEVTTAVERSSGAVVVGATGDLDLGSAHRLRDALVEAWETTRQPVAVHLSGVRFFDSFGLHALVTAWRVISTDGGELYLASASGPVRRVLAMTGTDFLLADAGRAPQPQSRTTPR